MGPYSKLIRTLVAVALLAIPAACSFKNGAAVSGTFRADASLPRSPGKGRGNYVGYLVNTSGPGISPTVSSASIGEFAPTCVDVGVSSLVVSYETISQKGVKLRIPAGPDRKIEVLGVTSSFSAQEILDKPVTALFEKGRRPELYRIAKQEGVHLFKDTRLDITASASAPTPLDILESCFPLTSTSPEEIPPESYSSLRVITFNSQPSSAFQNLTFDANGALAFAEANFFQTTGPRRVGVTPDRRRLVGWNDLTGYNETHSMLSSGSLVRGGSSASSSFMSGDSMAFSANGQYGVVGSGSLLNFLELISSYYQPNLTPSAPISGGVQLLGHRGKIYRIYIVNNDAFLDWGTLPEEGSFTTSIFGTPVAFPGVSTTQSSGRAISTTKGVYAPFVTSGNLKVVFFKFNASGDITSQGNPATLAVATYPDDSRLVATPDGKYLYAYFRTTLTDGYIRTFPLSSNGDMGGTSSDFLTTDFRDFDVDPLSKFLVISEGLGLQTKVTSYPILEGGTLGTTISTVNVAGGLISNIDRVFVIPVH